MQLSLVVLIFHDFYLYFTRDTDMAGFNYYKPKFNWDALDKLSKLDRFKADCEVLSMSL